MAKVSRNQKSVDIDEREKMKEGAKKQKEKDIEDKLTIANAEKVLFEEAKNNLPALLEQRIAEIETAIATELKEFSGLKETRIHQLISRQTYLSANGLVGYSPQELMIVFEAYKNVVVKVNSVVLFVPSRASFCAFAGISTNTFKNYIVSPDDQKRNAAQIIEDYIIEMNMSSSKMRKTDASTSIFEMKSVHQMTEATAPQIITVNHNENITSIQNKIKEIQDRAKVVDADFKEKEN